MTADRGAVASGTGSWPGTDVASAVALVRDELPDLPHLPELPARGPGSDLVGRAAARLVDLAVDLQPSGWRLVDRPGRDQARADAFWREDLDRLAHAYDGWHGPLKVQLSGPWTLAASLWLPRGERALSDHGARRDLMASSAESVRELVATVRRLVPGAEVVLQLDEPSVPAVLAAQVPTASGLRRLRSVPAAEVRDGLRQVLDAAHASGAGTVVHCCAADVPITLLREAGAQGVSVDVSLLDRTAWESLATGAEAGTVVWAGLIPTDGDLPPTADLVAALERPWRRLGLAGSGLGAVVVTPTCGLAGATPERARAAVVRAREVARELTERAQV